MGEVPISEGGHRHIMGRSHRFPGLASTWPTRLAVWFTPLALCTSGCGNTTTASTTSTAPLSVGSGAGLARGAAEPLLPSPEAAGPDDFAALVRVFARGQVAEIAGPTALRAWMREMLGAIASEPGASMEVAFVLDRTMPENVALALELSLAGNRAKLAQGGRFALLSSGSGNGAWWARVEAPLGDDPYAVVRAAGRVEWTPDGGGGGVGAALAGLVEATRLDWRAGKGHRHLVLLTDDRSRPEALRLRLHPERLHDR